jgi:hypothetical protein
MELNKAKSDELVTDYYLVKIGKFNAIIMELDKTNIITSQLEFENAKLKAEIANLRYDILTSIGC